MTKHSEMIRDIMNNKNGLIAVANIVTEIKELYNRLSNQSKYSDTNNILELILQEFVQTMGPKFNAEWNANTARKRVTVSLETRTYPAATILLKANGSINEIQNDIIISISFGITNNRLYITRQAFEIDSYNDKTEVDISIQYVITMFKDTTTSSRFKISVSSNEKQSQAELTNPSIEQINKEIDTYLT